MLQLQEKQEKQCKYNQYDPFFSGQWFPGRRILASKLIPEDSVNYNASLPNSCPAAVAVIRGKGGVRLKDGVGLHMRFGLGFACSRHRRLGEL